MKKSTRKKLIIKKWQRHDLAFRLEKRRVEGKNRKKPGRENGEV